MVNFGFSQGCKKVSHPDTSIKETWSGFANEARHREASPLQNMLKSVTSSCRLLAMSSMVRQVSCISKYHRLINSVTQGGDIGTAVTRGTGLLYPDHCRASHLNMMMPNPPTPMANQELYYKTQQHTLDEAEKQGVERVKWFREQGYGYNLEQSTKPQTIGYSMMDSPVGLLAWVYEKLHDWTDSYQWTSDEILTWISIYYFSTAGPHASQRIYYESTHDPAGFSKKVHEYNPHVKMGVARFPKEIIHTPKLWIHTYGPVVYESENDKGGHFAAWERPDVIVKDLRTMFGKGGGAYGVVKGRAGY